MRRCAIATALAAFAVATSVLGSVRLQGDQDGPAKAGHYLLFEGARLIVGDGRIIDNGAVLVEGDTITRVGRKGDVKAPAGAARVDLTGKTIMAGMVLAHGHIGYLRGTTFARENYTRDNVIDHLNRYLYYGVL